jgi:hypothetical protein
MSPIHVVRKSSHHPRRRERAGLLQLDGRLNGFLLGLDRNRSGPARLAAKFARYYRHRDGGRFARDYERFPTVLVVATEVEAEARLARVLDRLALGRAVRLPVLLTTTDRLADDPEGALGRVWRDPGDRNRERGVVRRRRWMADPVPAQRRSGSR